MKDILNQSTKARVKSHTPNEKRYGKVHIGSTAYRTTFRLLRTKITIDLLFPCKQII
jgi:hypothetical protein